MSGLERMAIQMQTTAIYARLSKDNGNSLSIETQEAECRRMAEYKGWAIGGVYVDNGISGATTDRPALTRLLADAAAQKFSIVLVARIDRLSRSVFRALDLIRVLEHHKVRLAVRDLDLDPTTPTGQAMLSMALVFAQLERDLISARTRDALRARRDRLEVFNGEPPYGFAREGKRLVPVLKELEIVRRVLAMRAEGLTYRQIGEVLAELQVPTKHGRSRWTPGTLHGLCGRADFYMPHLGSPPSEGPSNC